MGEQEGSIEVAEAARETEWTQPSFVGGARADIADLFCRQARRRLWRLHDGAFPWLEENTVSTWKEGG
jgi:hypothetical protein